MTLRIFVVKKTQDKIRWSSCVEFFTTFRKSVSVCWCSMGVLHFWCRVIMLENHYFAICKIDFRWMILKLLMKRRMLKQLALIQEYCCQRQRSFTIFTSRSCVFFEFWGWSWEAFKGIVVRWVVGNFLLELGSIHDYKPHFKETALVAISYLLRVHGMEFLFDFKHLYPNIHNALSVFVYYFVFRDVLTLFVCRSGELN